MLGYFILSLIILTAVAIILAIFYKKYYHVKLGAMLLISGGVKTGKTHLSVHLAIVEYKTRLFAWKVKNFVLKLFKKPLKEKPLLYSNIPLKCQYSPITTDLLERKTRFRYGSVIYVCEASLVADSQLFRDMELNDRLLEFNKLIGHETHGGTLIYDTQSPSDNHYAVKRCLNTYLYIHKAIKFLPFVCLLYVQERLFLDGERTSTQLGGDVDDLNLRWLIVPKKVWKMYDRYCYSCLTDDLPCDAHTEHGYKDLKARKIVSFKRRYNKDVK